MRTCRHLAPAGWRKILLNTVLSILILVKFSMTYGPRDSREPFSLVVYRRADGKRFKLGENPSLSKDLSHRVGVVKMSVPFSRSGVPEMQCSIFGPALR